MIWENVELFNVCDIEQRVDGAVRLYRFSNDARTAFANSHEISALSTGNMTTGCEIRFVGRSANILLSSQGCDGRVEVYRGDFLRSVEHLQAGIVKCVELRANDNMDKQFPTDYKGRFSPNVWRVVFDHDCQIMIHDIQPLSEIRPPHADEVPNKKIIAYGSSITHSACAVLYTNSYVHTMAKALNADVLCKGMGGNCFIQKPVADYVIQEDWDVALLELGINMLDCYPVSVFEERATYLIENILKQNKPVVLISNFTSFRSLPTDPLRQVNDDYVACLEKIYQRFACDHLFYIRGQDIVTDWEYLCSDLLHPSPYGHVEMGRKIAKILREDFKIL